MGNSPIVCIWLSSHNNTNNLGGKISKLFNWFLETSTFINVIGKFGNILK